MKIMEILNVIDEESNLATAELLKYERLPAEKKGKHSPDRPKIFIHKVSRGEPFTTITGQEFIVDPAMLDDIKSWFNNPQGHLIVRNLDGLELPSSKLRKTPEFGGKESGASVEKEVKARSQLEQALAELKGNKPFIKLKVGDSIINAATVTNTDGTPKSDFEIQDQNGISVAWISHKDGSPANPKKFGQWSGISHFSHNPIVQEFVNKLKKMIPHGMDRGATAVSMEFDPESELAMKAIYGKDFGSGEYGRNNVNMVLQGPPRIINTGDVYEITGLYVLNNGVVAPPPYNPVLSARYMSDRNDFGLPYTRVTIYPSGGRKFTSISNVEPK